MLIFALGAVVRIYRFGSIPQGIYQDEATLAYDAWSLVHFGVERNGTTFPIIFPAYGSGQSGTLAGYLAMPFMLFFGLHPVTTRIVNLLMSLIALPVAYGIGKEIKNERLGTIAMAVLAINPWHIMMSRWGLDCNLFPNLFLIGFLLLLHGRRSAGALIGAFVTFGLCLYSYGISYVFLPVFLLPASIWLLGNGVRWKTLLGAWCAFGAVAVPMATYLIINTLELPTLVIGPFTIPNFPVQPRYEEVSTLFGSRFFSQLSHNAGHFWSIVITQYDNSVANAIREFGTIYHASAVLLIGGFAVALGGLPKQWRRPHTLLLLWFVAAMAVGLCLEVNIYRINILFPVLVLLVAVGADLMMRTRLLTGIIIVTFAVLFAWFTTFYFTTYAKNFGGHFAATSHDAIRAAAAATNRKVCVSDTFVMPDIAVLYTLKLHPLQFANSVVYKDPHALFRSAQSFDRFVFGLANCPRNDTSFGAYVVNTGSERGNFSAREFRFVDFQYFSAAIRK